MPTKVKPIELIADQPISGTDDSDKLGMRPFAQVLAGVALGTDGPFNIGVYGGWGVGKTSMLKHVKSLIEAQNQPEVVTVWFNPWQFECEEHPLLPLVASIVQALDEHLKRGGASDVKSQSWLSAVHRNLRAIAYASSFELTAGPAKWKVDASRAVDREEALRQTADLFEGQIKYQNAFTALARCSDGIDGAGRIVVFVDDLDRCQPKNAIRLLEAIKLALGQKGFVFFLAVDNDIIEGYLTHAYSQELTLEAAADGAENAPYRYLARRYLHKLVQMDFPLPSHIAERFDDYLRASATGDFLRKRHQDDFVAIMRIGAAANPRSAVRLLNRLKVQWRLWDAMEMEAPEGVDSTQMPLTMAFSNVLLDRLGPRPFEQLITDAEACAALLPPNQSEDDSAQVGPADRVRQVVEPLLKEHKALGPMLASPIARLWLTNQELRTAVHSFFQKAEVLSDVPESQQEIVDRALRRELRLASDAPVPEQKTKEVIRLNLSGQSDFSDAGMPLLSRLASLQTLDLTHTQVSDAGLAYLSGLSSLQGLYLGGPQVSDAGLAHVSGLSSLQWLFLTDTEVSDAGLAHLSGLTSLRLLYLTGPQVSDAGLAHLSGLTSLQELHIGVRQVSDAGLGHLDALPTLEKLHLSDVTVTSDFLAHLASLPLLQVLHLYGGRIVGSSTACLPAANNLQELTLLRTAIKTNGLSALAGMCCLQRLSLRGVQVPRSDLQYLELLSALEELDLAETPLYDVDLQHLRCLSKLRRLDLSETKVTDDGLQHLRKLVNLDMIDVHSTRVTYSGKMVLQNELPHCIVIDDISG